MFNSKLNTIKLIGAVVALSMVITACSIDYNLLSEGIRDLGGVVAPSETTVVTETTNESEPNETTEETTAAPTPTATPVPTATPMPERVDFSELTKTDITEGFTVNEESFEEHYVEEGTDITLCYFTGERLLVEMPKNLNVQTAINLYVDAFYQKAAGEYQAAIQEARSTYTLNQAILDDEVKTISVSFGYSDNGRILSIIMRSEINTTKENIETNFEVVSFDMITGQIVTINTIAKNPELFKAVLKQESIPQIAEVTDPEAPVISGPTNNIKAEDVVDVYIVAQKPGAQTITVEVHGVTADGTTVCNTVDLAKYADYLNSFGKIAYGI